MPRDHRPVSEEGLQVPEADPVRCVHLRAGKATCRRCVDACPRQAWVFDVDELGIDAARCDGCGLCVAHCPEGALSQPSSLPQGAIVGLELSIACSLAPTAAGRHLVPCINAIGLHQLAAWYRAGLRSLVLNIAQCKGCRWADERGLVYRLVRWNRLLEKRGLGRLAVIVQQPRPTDEIAPGHDKGDTRLDRRGFLQRLLTAAEPAPANDELGLAPVTAAQPTAKRGDYILYAPVIDLDRCSGCDACIRICRHHALNPGDNGDTYQIVADRCSGCGLCVDVCDREAIVIIRDRVLPQAEVALYPQVCRACGAKFHPPRPATTNMPLCQVCSASNHYDRLFQVL